MGLRLRAEDFIYRTRLTAKGVLDGEDLRFDGKPQNDFVFSAGLQLFLNK